MLEARGGPNNRRLSVFLACSRPVFSLGEGTLRHEFFAVSEGDDHGSELLFTFSPTVASFSCWCSVGNAGMNPWSARKPVAWLEGRVPSISHLTHVLQGNQVPGCSSASPAIASIVQREAVGASEFLARSHCCKELSTSIEL